MIRIAIIEHNSHNLFIIDINEDLLNEKYNGNEEDYINDNFDVENYSWDYIVNSMYFGENCPYPYDLDDCCLEELREEDKECEGVEF